jgi:hypothetical protein
MLTNYEKALLKAFIASTKEAQLNILDAARRDPSVSGPLINHYRAALVK